MAIPTTLTEIAFDSLPPSSAKGEEYHKEEGFPLDEERSLGMYKE